ncbi:MAG: hypothetical protein JSU86_16780 [Phycisphaerales bacterium]|nr:MAG: hypothetical protein JSU86_16780 [Phycisphaerales bacterium]
MIDGLLQLAWVAYPILLGFVFLCLSVLRRPALGLSKLTVHLGILSFESPVHTTLILRISFLIAALLSFAFPAFRNYSDLFPTDLTMEVYFDDEGIQNAMAAWADQERNRLNIAEDWLGQRPEYLADMNSEVVQRFGNYGFRFSSDPSVVHSAGWSHFPVQKVRGKWQVYQIVGAHGHLTHTRYDESGEVYTLISEFRLRKSAGNYIDIGLEDIYFRCSTFFMPEFEQTLRVSAADSPELIYVMTAATKVWYVPYPVVGDTVYFRTRVSDGKRTPIAYARYDFGKS